MRVFRDNADREAFLDNVGSLVLQGSMVVYAYCYGQRRSKGQQRRSSVPNVSAASRYYGCMR